MANVNKVFLIGNLTRDVEIRYTPKGVAVGSFCLAINRQWKTEDGETKEEVTFVDCTVWQKRAEALAQYTKKGSPLHVEGRLSLEQWDDKQTGQKRSRLKVTVEDFQFLNAAPAKDGQQQRSEPAARPNHRAAAGLPAEEDSVPF